MSDERDDDAPLNVFDTLLMPLRLPGRVMSDIETMVNAVLALQSDAKEHLSSVDDSAAKLVDGLAKLQASIDRIDGRVEELETMEETITAHLQGVRSDLNERMIAVENEVRAMRPSMEQMASDVAKLDGLLPDPSDGPLARLKDTLTSSS
jgi:archaellum component FlaC